MNAGFRRALTVAKGVYAILVAGFLGWSLWHAGGQLDDWRLWLVEPASYGFVLCWALMAFLLGVAWAQVLRLCTGAQLHWREWLPIQGVAWAGRYLPGKVGLAIGKSALLERPGVELKPLAFSVLFEQLAFVLMGGVIAMLFFPPLSMYQFEWLDVIAELDAKRWRWGAAAAIAMLFFPLVHIIMARFGADGRSQAFQVLALFGLYFLAHLAAGLGLYIVLTRLLGGASPSFVYCVGLLAVANIAGIVAVFAPAGIGVRELMLTLGLSPFFSIEESLALSAVLRILTIVADMLFSSLSAGVKLCKVFSGPG